MFESLPSPASLACADDAAVVAAIEAAARAESGAAAARLAAIAELMERRLADDEENERGLWACDGWDSAAAEIAAALGISHRRASSQMHLAYALRTRLPKTAARLAEGAISPAIAATIAWRTRLVVDSDAMATIDSELATQSTRWGRLSDVQLGRSIDAVLEEHDPSARYEYNAAIRYRDVQFGKPDDATGTSSLFGSLKSPDAVLFDRRLRAMIRGVCSEDPRTIGERRSDAVGALLAGSDRLACRCGKPECVGGGTDSRAESVVIHVVADERAAQGAHAAKPAKPTKEPYYAAVLQGGGVVPPAQLAELIDCGAKISPLRAADQTAEPRYRPSAKLARFIRARDLTCRFPGCSASAEICDIDHTIPDERGGPTHPSNLACLCRKHHLLKTFWSEWSETQHPDGSITWTTPTGKTYTTHPGSRAVFPNWDTTTAPLPAPRATRPAAPDANRGLQMPRRKRTRRAEQAQRIKAERALHDSG